jgi:SSS family solute:Na+ symporter
VERERVGGRDRRFLADGLQPDEIANEWYWGWRAFGGEPRRSPDAWNRYKDWIETHAQDCAAKPRKGRRGYVIEWAISFNPCLEIEPGVFYSPKLGDRAMDSTLRWEISTTKKKVRGTSATSTMKTGGPELRMSARSYAIGAHYG